MRAAAQGPSAVLTTRTMRSWAKPLAGIAWLTVWLGVPTARADGLAGEQAQAQRVTILRDTWGIPHVFGHSDADAVFGLVYAQAEDDFNRVEWNYIDALGRRAEVEGEKALWGDLRRRLFINEEDLRAQYASSPLWLRKLMDAFADGLNFYLHTHPAVQPRLLTRFEPWMALAFSEGSIGGDIETISLEELARFYGKGAAMPPPAPQTLRLSEPGGSNGFAIAPSHSASGHALLLINPHTSFYFRAEVQAVSDEGLNAYGAVTWGQFFIYQGFNDRAGWMHTSDGADTIDEYLEQVVPLGKGLGYKFGNETRPVAARDIVLAYRSGAGLAHRTVTAFFTHRGPVVRSAADGRWVSVRLMQEPLKALTQSYLRTKARSYRAFLEVMDLRTNSSNNTVYADADGTIAYFHGNFVPVRDPRFDFTQPVDGADPATDWKGLHPVSETITLLNPRSGWLQNTNDWPFSAAGPFSPRLRDYPSYMWVTRENPRGVHAVRLLERQTDFTLDSLIRAAYDSQLTAFEALLPALYKAWDEAPGAEPLKQALAGPIAALRAWDLRSSTASVPTSLAILWARDLFEQVEATARRTRASPYELMAALPAQQKLEALARATARLERDFGTWQTPWGELNRFQRLSGAIAATFDDGQPSMPVGLAPSTWGALASFAPGKATGTKRLYGEKGNSFVAVVEFGPRVKAKSVLVGGESGNPASPHFVDQAERYARGELKDVWLSPEEIEAHLERRYHPGE
ncbi:MAG: penicillin acylase family protein [Myxococcaceae bacterium]